MAVGWQISFVLIDLDPASFADLPREIELPTVRRTAPSRANIGVARRTSAQGKRRSAGCNLQREAVQRTRPIVRVCPINPIITQIVPMNAPAQGCLATLSGVTSNQRRPSWVVTNSELVTGSPRPSPRFRLGTGEVPRCASGASLMGYFRSGD